MLIFGIRKLDNPFYTVLYAYTNNITLEFQQRTETLTASSLRFACALDSLALKGRPTGVMQLDKFELYQNRMCQNKRGRDYHG